MRPGRDPTIFAPARRRPVLSCEQWRMPPLAHQLLRPVVRGHQPAVGILHPDISDVADLTVENRMADPCYRHCVARADGQELGDAGVVPAHFDVEAEKVNPPISHRETVAPASSTRAAAWIVENCAVAGSRWVVQLSFPVYRFRRIRFHRGLVALPASVYLAIPYVPNGQVPRTCGRSLAASVIDRPKWAAMLNRLKQYAKAENLHPRTSASFLGDRLKPNRAAQALMVCT